MKQLEGKNIRLIALDMDATLLNSRKKITPRTLHALEEAERCGIEIVPATGRNAAGLPKELSGISHYALLLNGAIGMDLRTREILFQHNFSKADTMKIYDLLWNRFHRPTSVFLRGDPCMQEDQLDRIREYELPVMAEYIRGNRVPVPDIRKAIRECENGAGKVGMLHKPWEHDIGMIRDSFPDLPACDISDTGDAFDLNPKGIDKGQGLAELAALLQIPVDETMAFGDAGNDVPMIRRAGIGVCVANGTAEAKAAADMITLSNDEDGVAAVIEQIL